MESTGVFWIPVWNVLEQCEASFELTLINPQHVHALPGCKTDRKDGQRIAELLQYGLLKGSFIPPPPIRERRDLARRRAHLQGERNRVISRVRRLLETANIKLGSVVSDITGKTARPGQSPRLKKRPLPHCFHPSSAFLCLACSIR